MKGFNLIHLGLVATLAACSEAPTADSSAPPRSLLVVTIDTLRADRLGLYGYELARTPQIDALGQRGVTFETAFATAPITLPSHASLMTGTIPPRHGVRNNGTHRLVDEADTLAESLRGAGFRTGAFTAAYVLDSQFGLDQGFELYSDVPQHEFGAGGHVVQRAAEEVNAEAFAWIDELDPAEPFFLWVHYFEPHQPHPVERMPADLRARPYDGDVALGDRALGELLSHLEHAGRLDETLVVLTSDHGEGLGEHGEETHAIFVYQSTLHVPLVFSHASLPAGERIASWVSHVDVAPTVLELLGVDPPPLPPPARSLVPLMRGEASPDAPAYFESLVSLLSHGWAPLRGVALDDYKWIDAPRGELYHLPDDGGELRDRASDEPERAARARRALDALLSANEAIAPPERSSRALTAEDRAALESLGYASSEHDASANGEAHERVDPKDGQAFLLRQQDAYRAFRQGRPEEALSLLEQLVTDAPDNPVFRSDLGAMLIQLGRHAEALVLVRGAIERGFRTSDVLCNLGACQLATGAPAEAEATFLQALEIDAKHLMSLNGLGQSRAALGDTAGARESLESFLTLWHGDEQTAAAVRQQLESLR